MTDRPTVARLQIEGTRHDAYIQLTREGLSHDGALAFLDRFFPIEMLSRHRNGGPRCRNGHLYTGKTRLQKKRGRVYRVRDCIECKRDTDARYRQRQAA